MKERKLKLYSWNVNGIRAVEKKGFLNWLNKSDADIVCIQEIKVQDIEVLSSELRNPKEYKAIWNTDKEKKGYSGVLVYTKLNPKGVKIDFKSDILSKEGRVIECDFGSFVLLNVYFPNGGMSEERLKYKLKFYDEFLTYVKKLLRSGRDVIFCGDINTAHSEIDLARPKENANNTGFLKIEREWIDKVIKEGFIDSFRLFHSEGGRYTYWDLKTFARDRNVGWRIDYFFVSENLKKNLRDAFINNEVMGSDHCPLGISIEI